MKPILIGSRVRFAPNPRFPDDTVEAIVVRHRKSPNANTLMATTGWLDTVDEFDITRSVRPSRCEVL